MEFDIAKRREDLVQKVVGTGRHRKIILASALSKDTRYHAESISYAMPQPTLEFGMLCLKNALFTLSMTEEEARSLSVSCPAVSATTTGVSMSLSGGLGKMIKINICYCHGNSYRDSNFELLTHTHTHTYFNVS